MDEITLKVTERECPNCKFRVTQTEVVVMRWDFDCPRCRKHPVSQFTPVDNTDPEPPKPPTKRRKPPKADYRLVS